MKENKIKIIIFLSIMFIIVGIESLVMLITNKKDNPDDIHENITENYKFSEVFDINEYQTVYNNLKNYYTSINGNPTATLSLLFEDYKSINKITNVNLDNYIEKKYSLFEYEINEIQKYYNPYYAFYYIKGEYRLEELDNIIEQQDVKDIVIEDIIQGTYAILPILNLNDDFEIIINRYNLENYDKEIIKNSYNEIQSQNVNEFNESLMYFNEFLTILNNDCNEAYNLVGEQTKIEYANLNEFKKICDSYKNENISPVIKNYEINYKDGKKNILITDSYSTRFIFIINSIKNYVVDITK